MKMVSGAHGVDDDISESARIKALNLDVIAKGSKVTVQGAKLGGAPVIVGVLRRRNVHRHRRTVGM